MRELLLTLGHNSSAILLDDGVVQWGYETERLTKVKSDSRFPLQYLRDAGVDVGKVDMAYVSHWSPDGLLSSMSTKHWDPSNGLEGVRIHTLNPLNGRSHHDVHMAAALRYADSHVKFPRKESYGLVVDGFGNLGEHFSVYDLSGSEPRLVKRVHGYDTSLGLWYQYATAFMGMKMHEDEYKLLGYEAHVEPNRWAEIRLYASRLANMWLDRMSQSTYGSVYDPLYDVAALPNVKNHIFNVLHRACQDLGISGVQEFTGRAELSVLVQAVLEDVVCTIVSEFNPTNLVLSGGCFYNVKLNMQLMKQVDGVTCAYPLAGDQGTAIGLYAMTNPNWVHPTDLCWGKRVLRDVGKVEGLHVVDEDYAWLLVKNYINEFGYVNLVRGDMEFGPRALCNTSTLALPTKENVATINAMNDRNTVMPMAPVMSKTMYNKTFERTDHVWMSQMHMIIALEHAEHPLPEHMGVAHEYVAPYKHHTSRPQVAADPFMLSLLDQFSGTLINTSFNFHGVPIAWGMPEVIHSHLAQHERNPNIQTVVIKNA